MTRREIRSTGSLAAIFAMRLLGLFMIYPVFGGYARHLRAATPETIGLALGVYGLTQGMLQIPFGLLSDRIGRKIMITLGLVLFGAGSAVAALATSIVGMILGRVLQGTGAVGSVILALIADLTREEARTKAMAIVMTIGFSFVVAIGIGPLVASMIDVPGIFWLTALMALIGIAITHGLVPPPSRIVRHRDAEAVSALLGRVLRDRELLRLDFAIFTLHAILTASFLAVPPLLFGSLHLAASRDWLVYLPVLGSSALLMVLAIIFAERRQRMKEVSIAAIVTMAASLLALVLAGKVVAAALLALVGFFTAFNVMEAILPSLVTKIAPAGTKGTATGVYSSSQFIGIFVGGAVGGWALAVGGATGVFGFALIATLLWLPVAATMSRPGHYSSYLVPLRMGEERAPGALAASFETLPGVIEAAVAADEGVVHLKIDRARFDPAFAARIIAG